MLGLCIEERLLRARPREPNPRKHKAGRQGFSLPEVMVSSVLLAMVVVNSTNLFMQSGSNIRASGLRDAIHARIAEDIEELRRTSMEWACSPGTACTGQAIDADKPVAYQTATTNAGAYKTACSSSTLAGLMQQQLPTALPSGSTQLDWGHNRPKGIVIPAALTTLTINRNISANGNQLEVSYETGPSAPFKVELHSSLVPEALGWCA